MDYKRYTHEKIKNSLMDFKGKRRFEYKGTVGGVKIVDDYAHHPTEVTATLKPQLESYTVQYPMVCFPASYIQQNKKTP